VERAVGPDLGDVTRDAGQLELRQLAEIERQGIAAGR
jgi:hypothetical protein